MGSVHSTTVGLDGSVGVRAGMPPRSRITSSGSAFGSADSERNRLAIRATSSASLPVSPCSCGSRRAQAILLAWSVVESTSSRRFTTHQIRVGAVRSAGSRSACEASHQMAMSRHAVFPRPVGMPTGRQSRPEARSAASSACQGNGSRWLMASYHAVKDGIGGGPVWRTEVGDSAIAVTS